MGITARAQVDVGFSASQDVPLGGFYRLFADGAALAGLPSPAFVGGVGKVGDGHGRDGYGPDGFGEGGPGDGAGFDGYGPDGIGAPAVSMRTAELADAAYSLQAVAYDPAGNAAAGSASVAAVVHGTPRRPGWPEPSEYDPATDRLTITLGELSADDDDA